MDQAAHDDAAVQQETRRITKLNKRRWWMSFCPHMPSDTTDIHMKTRKVRAWTPLDVRTIKAMAKHRKRASAIARKLKRTEGATRQKAFSIGLSLDARA